MSHCGHENKDLAMGWPDVLPAPLGEPFGIQPFLALCNKGLNSVTLTFKKSLSK